MAINDELANDRTFLAWLRTGIASMALGFVVAKIAFLIRADGHRVDDKAFYTVTGVLLVLCGGALIVTGLWQHRQVFRSMHADGSLPRWPRVMTVIAVLMSIALATLILVSA
jgi:putative membrane protein